MRGKAGKTKRFLMISPGGVGVVGYWGDGYGVRFLLRIFSDEIGKVLVNTRGLIVGERRGYLSQTWASFLGLDASWGEEGRRGRGHRRYLDLAL